MPAPVSSRARQPPAKKQKLSQPPPPTKRNGLKALLNGGPKPIVAAKPSTARDKGKHRVDEATAVVEGHADIDMVDAGKETEVIEISSAEESSHYTDSEDEDIDDAHPGAEEEAAPLTNGDAHEEEPVEGGEDEETFGERLKAEPEARVPKIVDVESMFEGPNADLKALATKSSNAPLSVPNASSLGTVLSQALKTNDQGLLDSCLRVVDVDTIYATVERLPSPLVGSLLEKLATRLHRRPGRAGMLMIWVQWSLAAHGGYLASQPQIVKQLATLNKVLKERASGLNPLLALKGRLDMLHAQMELRRRNQRREANDDEEEAVIYVEGEDDISSAEEGDQSDVDNDVAPTSLRKRLRQGSEEMEDESSVDEMPTTMEVDEDESDEGSEDSEGLLDDEASETDNDTGDDLSDPETDDELDDGEDVSESDEESRPARRSTIGRAGLSRR
ncbi:Dip2/Utp12 family-domain-containing protein [Lophiotrema nucula]|uniref:Dip2/Utp12 family-domain-containing protein n=1 Tax=Lophiotrema nucula TaxID=690887 RepID=A0A6A5YGR1_9PLEO|nr:Dip2/Utp12 family-domain-containing protein [Lophiotrema nucula]